MFFHVISPKAALTSVVVAVGMTGFGVAQTTTPRTGQTSSQTTSTQNNMNSKATVRDAQQQLKKDGYYTGKIDGEDGPETRAAIEKYQQSQHLKVTGQLDNETCSKMGIKK